MTIINLKVGYFVEKKKNCQYTLKYRYTGKSRDGKPKETTKTIGHFNKMLPLIECFAKCASDDVTDGEVIELKEYAEIIDRASKLAVQGLDKVLSEYEVK